MLFRGLLLFPDTWISAEKKSYISQKTFTAPLPFSDQMER